MIWEVDKSKKKNTRTSRDKKASQKEKVVNHHHQTTTANSMRHMFLSVHCKYNLQNSTHQHRIILRPSCQNLQCATYLLMSTNNRIQLPFLGQLCQIDSILLQCLSWFGVIVTILRSMLEYVAEIAIWRLGWEEVALLLNGIPAAVAADCSRRRRRRRGQQDRKRTLPLMRRILHGCLTEAQRLLCCCCGGQHHSRRGRKKARMM